jgi:hypothetical protein
MNQATTDCAGKPVVRAGYGTRQCRVNRERPDSRAYSTGVAGMPRGQGVGADGEVDGSRLRTPVSAARGKWIHGEADQQE